MSQNASARPAISATKNGPARTAVLAVNRKSGIVQLAQRLETAGWELTASIGTATALRAGGIRVSTFAEKLASVMGPTMGPELTRELFASAIAAMISRRATLLGAPGARAIAQRAPFASPIRRVVPRGGVRTHRQATYSRIACCRCAPTTQHRPTLVGRQFQG